jgi:Zn-dependent M28 family amino/carboxypeptidase
MRLMIAAALLAATATPLPARQAEPAFSSERVRADVEFLADDLLEGRDAGTRGYDIAALYVASRFAALGLAPAGTKSWYQPITFARATLQDDAINALTIGGKTFPVGEDVAMGGSAHQLHQLAAGRAVFVGYGLDSPEHGFDDYSGLDVRGKVVVMLSGMPDRGTSSEIAAHLSSQKARMAERRGAIAAITIPTRAALARTPWAAIRKSVAAPRFTWIAPDGRAWAPGVKIAAQVNGAAAEALFAGSRMTLKQVLDQAASKGAMPRGFALRAPVRLERHSTVERMQSSNVVGLIPGSDPALSREVVLITAHLDHEGVDPEREGDKIYNGAMDNAAGIATMLEVARAFAATGQRPKRSVMFAAVTAEEDGLLGSQYLAKHPLAPKGGKVVGVINLDMPVLTYDFSDVIAFGAQHSTLGPIAEQALASAGVKVSPDPMPEQGIFTRSDHYSFVVEGVPSIMLATGFAGEGRTKFTNFLAKTYHRPNDDLSQDFNWAAGAKFAQVNYLIARAVADGTEAPRWYADNFFGETFARSAPKAARPKGRP